MIHNIKEKGKGFPYSWAQCLSACTGSQSVRSHPPGSRLPLLIARLAVTFPASEHHWPLAKLYCLVTEAHKCKQLDQGCYAALPWVTSAAKSVTLINIYRPTSHALSSAFFDKLPWICQFRDRRTDGWRLLDVRAKAARRATRTCSTWLQKHSKSFRESPERFRIFNKYNLDVIFAHKASKCAFQSKSSAIFILSSLMHLIMT